MFYFNQSSICQLLKIKLSSNIRNIGFSKQEFKSFLNWRKQGKLLDHSGMT